MFVPHTEVIAILLLFFTMILWSAWPNLIKAARGARFEIFYIDFVIGALLMSVILGLTVGTWGDYGLTFFESVVHAHFKHILRAFLAGVLFNIAYVSLVGSSAFSGISYTFISCFGVALIIDTTMEIFVPTFIHSFFVFFGIAFIFLAILLMTIAQRKNPQKIRLAKKTLSFSILSGILIGLFYPLLERSLTLYHEHGLGPYAANFFFALGLMTCNLFFIPLLMKKPILGTPINFDSYISTKKSLHGMGLLAGALWSLGLSFRLISEPVAGSLAAYIFAQVAVLLIFLSGFFYWKETPSDMGLYKYVLLGFLCYIFGLFFIIFSKLPY